MYFVEMVGAIFIAQTIVREGVAFLK